MFQLSVAEGAERVLSLNGLGDSKPTELMENMLSLLGSWDASFLFVQLFLRQLPPLVCTALASLPFSCTKDFRALAEEAERILLASQKYALHGMSLTQTPAEESAAATVASVPARQKKDHVPGKRHQPASAPDAWTDESGLDWMRLTVLPFAPSAPGS